MRTSKSKGIKAANQKLEADPAHIIASSGNDKYFVWNSVADEVLLENVTLRQAKEYCEKRSLSYDILSRRTKEQLQELRAPEPKRPLIRNRIFRFDDGYRVGDMWNGKVIQQKPLSLEQAIEFCRDREAPFDIANHAGKRKEDDKPQPSEINQASENLSDELTDLIVRYGEDTRTPTPSAKVKSASLPKKWWFLTEQRFDEDQEAQAYEVICRHGSFPTSVCAMNLRLTHCPPWPKVSKAKRRRFYVEFASDLARMGFPRFVVLGKKRVTFNCVPDAEVIVAAARFGIAIQHRYARRDKPCFPVGNLNATKTPTNKLVMGIGLRNSDMITIDWSALVKWLQKRRTRGTPRVWSCENLVAALETFLTKNRDYRRHRKARIKARKKALRKRIRYLSRYWNGQPQHAAETIRRASIRPNKPKGLIVALGCVAHDWKKTGKTWTELFQFLRSVIPKHALEYLGLTNNPPRPNVYWNNALRTLRRIQAVVNLRSV